MHGDEVRRRAFAEDKHCRVFYNYTRPQHTGFYEERAHLCKNKTHWNTKMQPEKRVFNWRTVCSEWRWCEEKWWEPRAFGLPNCLVFNFFFFWNFSFTCQTLFGLQKFWMPASKREADERAAERAARRAAERAAEKANGWWKHSEKFTNFPKTKVQLLKEKAVCLTDCNWFGNFFLCACQNTFRLEPRRGRTLLRPLFLVHLATFVYTNWSKQLLRRWSKTDTPITHTTSSSRKV